MQQRHWTARVCAVVCFVTASASAGPASSTSHYEFEVLPPEHRHMADPETGAELTFLTTHADRDWNLYYHARSWLADGSVILFYSSRADNGLMGYLTATGELVRFSTAGGPLKGATAALHGPRIYGVRNGQAVELMLELALTDAPETRPSQVRVAERVLCALPDSGGQGIDLRENCDGSYLAFRINGQRDSEGPRIYRINVESGECELLLELAPEPGDIAHVQWSRTTPHLLSFNSTLEGAVYTGPRRPSTGPLDYVSRRQRLWVMDVRNPEPYNVYEALEGELVTHVVWWMDDHMVFCGGIQPDVEAGVLSHVKTIDVRTGVVRVVGAGNWWPDGSPSAAARRNWWHASGSEDGSWLVADNWHGDLVLFEGKNTRPHLLTTGHRTYGGGTHPHPGWDRAGRHVVFGTEMLGAPNVCVAAIPQRLQDLVDCNTDGTEGHLPWAHEQRVNQSNE